MSTPGAPGDVNRVFWEPLAQAAWPEPATRATPRAGSLGQEPVCSGRGRPIPGAPHNRALVGAVAGLAGSSGASDSKTRVRLLLALQPRADRKTDRGRQRGCFPDSARVISGNGSALLPSGCCQPCHLCPLDRSPKEAPSPSGAAQPPQPPPAPRG